MIYFSINSDAITPHAILPDNKVWIKLSINKDSDVYPALENIYTQVVDAEFINRENDITHLEKGLPQAAISKAVNTIQGIKSILQPYCSYGGRPVENPKSFYTRISERLRHKDRAWNVWDYERLILEHYPSILKAKCIPYSNNNVGYSPGSIFIILLPDCNIISQIDIYKPIVNKALIDRARRTKSGS